MTRTSSAAAAAAFGAALFLAASAAALAGDGVALSERGAETVTFLTEKVEAIEKERRAGEVTGGRRVRQRVDPDRAADDLQ